MTTLPLRRPPRPRLLQNAVREADRAVRKLLWLKLARAELWRAARGAVALARVKGEGGAVGRLHRQHHLREPAVPRQRLGCRGEPRAEPAPLGVPRQLQLGDVEGGLARLDRELALHKPEQRVPRVEEEEVERFADRAALLRVRLVPPRRRENLVHVVPHQRRRRTLQLGRQGRRAARTQRKVRKPSKGRRCRWRQALRRRRRRDDVGCVPPRRHDV
mmetsp:Transcript_30391/g.95382  ORF Transcript_30391/g.95382 Transcript_30391/m.95382 type:complete len:217 (-) Transcript_30391:15-665(-)